MSEDVGGGGAKPASPEAVQRKVRLVVCENCPAEKRHREGGVVWIDDEEVTIRQGRPCAICTVCKGSVVDIVSGMCFQCNSVQVIQYFMLCVECKRRAPEVTVLSPKPENFFCDMEASDMCSEGNFMAQLSTCESKHQACAECFFLYLESQIQCRELRWSYKQERFTIGCFGYNTSKGGLAVKCDALLHDFCCFNMLSADTCEKYARFSLEKLTERLEGIICPLPRCGEALLDVPPIAQQKCIRCPYCLKCFCQKCKVEVEVLGMNGDLILANGGNRGDSEEEEGGGSRDVDREVATGGGSKSVQDLSKNFKFLCKSCDLEWAGKDAETQALIKGSSKPCPFCEMPTTHYRGHACHHIRGCLNCRQHWCYNCSGKSRAKNEWAPSCDCASTGLCFCDMEGSCGCPICPDCRPGKKCPNCSGGDKCPSCNPDHPEHGAAKKLWEAYYGVVL